MPVAATKALRKASESGDPLPLPGAMHEVQQRGGVLRRGHMVMIAGISNSGKSAFAEWIAAETNVDTLYFSADQDAWTSTTRLAALLSGHTVHAVAEAIADGGNGEAFYGSMLEKSRLHFCFDSNPSLEDVGCELDAYVDTWDQYPDLIVIDNIVNIDAAGEHHDDQWIMSELHGLARRTKACVVVLAHAKEGTIKDPSMPPPKKEIYNQLQRWPDLILTIALDPETAEFRVAIVKCREAAADPLAKRPVVMGSDFSRCMFTARPARPTWGGWDNDER